MGSAGVADTGDELSVFVRPEAADVLARIAPCVAQGAQGQVASAGVAGCVSVSGGACACAENEEQARACLEEKLSHPRT